ncbi:MAG: 16S rRNA (cytidine(1402)-2'-O)-methyltransferase [Bacteroidales bacterium]
MSGRSEIYGSLILVPTPVGNMKDMTFRAVEVLKGVDRILAEDTRVSGKLLKHYHIGSPLESYHQHNEHKLVGGFVERLLQGETFALITDAGTPAISDPGFLLVREAIKNGVHIECLPGPTSIIPALAASGLPAARFYMEGFLPRKKGRQARLEDIAQRPETILLMESPYRLLKTLRQLAEHCGSSRKACVCREISKLHEEYARGSLQEIVEDFQQRPAIKGEIVIVMEGKA